MKKGIGIMTGCFNPIQNSHFNMAKDVLERFSFLEKVVFVPVGDYYVKAELKSAEDRVEMIQAVCKNHKHMEISRIEIEQDRQLFTYETLAILQQEYKEHLLYIIMGGDNLVELDTWEHVQEILENYYVIAFTRNENCVENIIQENATLQKYKERILGITSKDILDISSTLVRKYCEEGRCIKDLVPKEAYQVLNQKKLYE